MTTKKTVTILAAGGCGCNLIQNVINIPNNIAGYADVEYFLVDTSESDILPETKTGKGNKKIGQYLIPGMDGSGKNRRFGYENVKPHVNEILTQVKPKDFTIVLFSLSGGSGSVIGPLLLEELIRRKESVVAICVGNAANGIEAENTMKTIATLQNLSSKILNQPIVASFYVNDNETSRLDVDKKIESDVRALCLMMSGSNRGLDSEDIHNLLYYSALPMVDVPAQLTELIVNAKTSDQTMLSGFTAIAVASVLPDESEPLLELMQPYGCVGYMPVGITQSMDTKMPSLHFILTNAKMNERMEKMQSQLKQFKEAQDALKRTPLLVPVEASDDSGFAF